MATEHGMAKRDDPIFNIKLAAEVKKYPCIYDFKLPDYSKRDVTESAWENVATVLNDEGKYIIIRNKYDHTK